MVIVYNSFIMFYNGINQSYQGRFAIEKEILVFIVRLQGPEKIPLHYDLWQKISWNIFQLYYTTPNILGLFYTT